jgi:hypothetical protein
VGTSSSLGRAAAPDAGSLNHGLLRDVPAQHVAVVVAVLAVIGALAAGWMRWGRTTSRTMRTTALAAVAVVGAGALVLVDATVLAGLGYLPAMAIMSAFSAEVRDKLDVYVQPDFVFQVVVLVGTVLIAVTAVRYARRTAGACERCGRRSDGADPAWTTPAAAARWGRIAALVAAAIPAFYAVTRLAWALGIPLGFDRAHVDEMEGMDLIGPIGLGTFALLGAVLTLGLYQRWGEVFPRWMVGLAGRRVPIGLAVVPASLVAVAVMPAGISMIGMFAAGGPISVDFAADWAAVVPVVGGGRGARGGGAAAGAGGRGGRAARRACGRG